MLNCVSCKRSWITSVVGNSERGQGKVNMHCSFCVLCIQCCNEIGLGTISTGWSGMFAMFVIQKYFVFRLYSNSKTS